MKTTKVIYASLANQSSFTFNIGVVGFDAKRVKIKQVAFLDDGTGADLFLVRWRNINQIIAICGDVSNVQSTDLDFPVNSSVQQTQTFELITTAGAVSNQSGDIALIVEFYDVL